MTKTTPPLCADAVIVVPGIMGSELVESETGTILWGMSPKSYASLWTNGLLWEKLKVSDRERSGTDDRIKATRLLTSPAFAPVLRGLEPYSRLIAGIRAITRHRDAVRGFPYDWRLSISHNAHRLAIASEQHLAYWRRHHRGTLDAKLVIVAHSMGGLIAEFFTGILGGSAEVRQTVTIGTPFQGAAKAVFLLARGDGGPQSLPRRRLRSLARTMPAVHDLLPSYRCVCDGRSTRRLAATEIRELGGDIDLARAATDLHHAFANIRAHNLRTIVGVEQPTVQSLRLLHGAALPQYYLPEESGFVDWGGDGTVYTQAATGGVEPASLLPQSHGALARSSEAIAAVRAALTWQRLGPPMGSAGVGLQLPDIVAAKQPFDVIVKTKNDKDHVTCRIVDANNDMQIARPLLTRRRSSVGALIQLPQAGLYRIEVKSGGFSALSQLIMATESQYIATATARLATIQDD